MLLPGKIPKEEPIIRVGIVLPEDKQKQLKLICAAGVIMQTDDSPTIRYSMLDLEIDLFNRQLIIKSNESIFQAKSLFLELENNDTTITVEPVIAGRGFHWEKKINVKLSHRLEIKIRQNSLVVINELPLEDYLACVSTSEMGTDCPQEFIRAQTIVARSWMLANVEQKHIHLGFDVCNDDCCQRFQGHNNLNRSAYNAAKSSRGLVLVYDSKICDARYSKSCGGVMERFENLWEPIALPYMQNKLDANEGKLPDLTDEAVFSDWIKSIPDTFCSSKQLSEELLPKYLGDVDEAGKYFRWEIPISQDELLSNVNSKLNLNAKAILELKPKKRAGSGRMLELELVYLSPRNDKQSILIFKDYEVRRILHPDFLYSSACSIEAIEEAGKYPDFVYHGGGWGHGAGMCQIGALSMALQGYDFENIVNHYYPGSKLKKIYD